MELFNLLAKLTLDSSDFNSGLEEAQHDANSFDLPDQSLGLDTSDFDTGVKEAENTGSEFAKSMKQVFDEIKGALVVTGVVAAIGQITGFLREGVDLAAKNGDRIDKQSQKLNMTTKAYQELDYALGLSGSSIDDLSRGMRTFTEIQGGKVTDDQAAAFEKLGINAKKANGEIKDAQSLMEETLYTLADYKGEDRGLLTEYFFGKNSAGLNALLNSGSKGIKEMRKEAESLGLVMSDEEIKNAAAYTDATSRLEQSLTGIKTELAGGIIPLLTEAADTLATVIAFFSGRNKEKSLSDMFADTDGEMADSLATIESTSAVAESLADKLLKMGDTGKMTADQYAIWKGTAEQLISLVPSLGDVIDTETGKIDGNSESIKENIKQWENLAKTKALQQAKEEKFQAIVEKNQGLIDKQIEANTKEAELTAARAESLQNVNKILAANGYDTLGDAATWQEIADAQQRIVTDQPENYGLLMDISKAAGEWTKANNEYEAAKKQAEELAAEIAKAQQEYETWCAAADALYGTLDGDAGSATTAVQTLASELNGLPDVKHIRVTVDNIRAYPQAKGDWSVPYDNYPSLLHRGEMVLTASQARRYREGETGGIDSATVQELLIEVRALRKRNIMMDGDKVADLTTERTKKNINAESYAKQRAYGG